MKIGAINGVPQLVLLIFILYPISLNSRLAGWPLFLIQTTIIALFGLFGATESIQARVEAIRRREYILAAQSCGRRPVGIILRHVLPNLRETLLIQLTAELTAALNLMGQLGIFNIFLGGTIFTPAPLLLHSYSREWAGLLGQARWAFIGQQWILIFPLAGYLTVFLAFQLTARGIELRYVHRLKRYPHI